MDAVSSLRSSLIGIAGNDNAFSSGVVSPTNAVRVSRFSCVDSSRLDGVGVASTEYRPSCSIQDPRS